MDGFSLISPTLPGIGVVYVVNLNTNNKSRSWESEDKLLQLKGFLARFVYHHTPEESTQPAKTETAPSFTPSQIPFKIQTSEKKGSNSIPTFIETSIFNGNRWTSQ